MVVVVKLGLMVVVVGALKVSFCEVNLSLFSGYESLFFVFLGESLFSGYESLFIFRILMMMTKSESLFLDPRS
jgi:hypothetical protein